MTWELAVRFLLGGAIVSLFAAVGEMFKPKTFAGLFGAAPSVAIATLAIAYHGKDGGYVAVEARSMLLGCAALFVYAAACVAATSWKEVPVWLGAMLAWGAWAAVAFGSLAVVRAAGAFP
jgi:hypothetical protein